MSHGSAAWPAYASAHARSALLRDREKKFHPKIFQKQKKTHAHTDIRSDAAPSFAAIRDVIEIRNRNRSTNKWLPSKRPGAGRGHRKGHSSDKRAVSVSSFTDRPQLSGGFVLIYERVGLLVAGHKTEERRRRRRVRPVASHQPNPPASSSSILIDLVSGRSSSSLPPRPPPALPRRCCFRRRRRRRRRRQKGRRRQK